MNEITKLAVAAALIGASASASAWSLSPQPVYGPPPAPFAVAAPTEAQQQAFAEQQSRMIEQAIETQRKLAEQFSARQAEMVRHRQERRVFDPMSSDPFARMEPPAPPALEMPSLESPFGPPLPEQVKKAMEASNAYAKKRMDESNARFEQVRKEMTAEREALIKAMETRRNEALSRPAPLAYQVPAAPVL